MYIVSGIGSILLWVFVGAATLVPFILKTNWRRVKSWFSRKKEASEIQQGR